MSDEIDRVLDGNTLAHDIPIPEDSHTSTSSNTGTSLSNLQGTISTTSYLVPGQLNPIKFPKRQFGKFNRAFQGNWFNDFPWLHYDESNDKVFCHTCMRAEFEGKLRTARNKDPAFVIDGYCNCMEKSA